jgi:hypothetical protein
MAQITVKFIADATGDSISFSSTSSPALMKVTGASLKKITVPATLPNPVIKEFLIGNTDDGREIFFRADTQNMQMNPQFETFSNPMAIATKLQRGTMVKCFVSLDEGDFYEVAGTVTKGVSIVKIHSKDLKSLPTPPNAREIKISWRDSSKQLCRILQTSIIFIPGTMDFSE